MNRVLIAESFADDRTLVENGSGVKNMLGVIDHAFCIVPDMVIQCIVFDDQRLTVNGLAVQIIPIVKTSLLRCLPLVQSPMNAEKYTFIDLMQIKTYKYIGCTCCPIHLCMFTL